MTDWTADDVPRLDGDVIVVTGANSGLGLAATRVFAARGATVVMACRSTDRGEAAAAEVRETTDDGELDVRACDLAELETVAAFADGVRADYDGVDVLCNNAGVMAIPRSETADGFETQLGVNHMGHFALTGHLLPALVAAGTRSAPARVVTQSSGAHEMGEMDFTDLHWEESYSKWGAYGRSKLANLLFAYELDRRLDDHGLPVESLACHPGYAATNLQLRTGAASQLPFAETVMGLAATTSARTGSPRCGATRKSSRPARRRTTRRTPSGSGSGPSPTRASPTSSRRHTRPPDSAVPGVQHALERVGEQRDGGGRRQQRGHREHDPPPVQRERREFAADGLAPRLVGRRHRQDRGGGRPEL
jgi:NAD(P)-dependent dehydrogenase (short-subunit alcohol dehydrogenase family)